MNFDLKLITDAKRIDDDTLTFLYEGLSVTLMRELNEWEVCLNIRVSDLSINCNNAASDSDIALFRNVETIIRNTERSAQDFASVETVRRLKELNVI